MGNNYIIYLLVWIALTLFLIIFYKFMRKKMLQTGDRQSKNSLFFILMIIGIPVLMFVSIAPIIVIGGDENMPQSYRNIFYFCAGALVIYFIFSQRRKNPEEESN